jgi:ABC-type multidrug transport system fused ATPase/permease subunit
LNTSIKKSVQKAFALLSKRDQRVLFIATGLQMLLALLDLAGVLLLGLVAASAAGAATGTPLNVNGISILGDLLPTGTNAIIFLAFIAAILLVSKSIISLFFTRRIFRFIANRQAMIAGNIAERLLNRPLLELQMRSSQETTAALTSGINAITIGTLGPSIVIGAEIALVISMSVGLIFVDPLVAIFTIVFFGSITLLLQGLLGNWAQSLGLRSTTAEIGSMVSIQDALQTYREVTVAGRRRLFISRFQNLRWEAAKVQADTYILNQIGKYVFEISLIIGGGLLVLLMSVTRDVTSAVAIITVFLASSSRIFPSLMRLQTSMANIRNSTGTAEYTYRLVDALDQAELDYVPPAISETTAQQFNEAIYTEFPGFSATVECTDVSLQYPMADQPALSNVSLSISAGESVALVGSTGAGKSTLADVILGVLFPSSGNVKISGLQPLDVVSKWPGAMAYVPQDVKVLSGTVRENVALGIRPEDIDDSLVWEALERAHLADFLTQDRLGIETEVGENGVQLSGGQRQRLGIARGLYSRPRLLVLDEATSALDAETEKAITDTLDSLVGEVTLIVIAHRLATVRNCNQVIYLRDGVIASSGSFEHVRNSVPDFDTQAKILGL